MTVLSYYDDGGYLSGIRLAGGQIEIGLTKFLQVVHRVHVVHALAIEVEPGERNLLLYSE